jgi:hypothetical protein
VEEEEDVNLTTARKQREKHTEEEKYSGGVDIPISGMPLVNSFFQPELTS